MLGIKTVETVDGRDELFGVAAFAHPSYAGRPGLFNDTAIDQSPVLAIADAQIVLPRQSEHWSVGRGIGGELGKLVVSTARTMMVVGCRGDEWVRVDMRSGEIVHENIREPMMVGSWSITCPLGEDRETVFTFPPVG